MLIPGRPAFMLIVLLALSACAKKAEESNMAAGAEPTLIAGAAPKSGSLLAYEHEVAFEVPPDTMMRRIGAVQAACNEERAGACSVLSIDSTAGNYPKASITVRVVPAGVEPLVALAGEGAAIESRSTTAEDLAAAVADVVSRQDLLRRQRETLLAFVARKDIPVGDMIAVSRELASVDSQLQGLAQDAASQQRRIETNRLTILLRSDSTAELGSRFSFRAIWHSFTDSLAEGTESAAEYAGYFLPLLLLVFPLALTWRWAWRWATRRSRAGP